MNQKIIFKYHKNYLQFNSEPEILFILKSLTNNCTILEFGCHTGLLSRALKENKNAQVVGIDINIDALKIAKPFQFETLHANIENIDDWLTKVPKYSFNVITFLHVLEHLRNPQEVLIASLALLKPGGIVIIGLPNVSNAKDRFDMTFGKFEYTEIGVMDKTHIQMFNYITANKMIEDCGLIIEDYFSPWRVNPFKHFFNHLPLFCKIAKKMSDKPPKFYKISPNITDSTMLFKCKLKNI